MDLRFPSIKGVTEKEKINEIYRFLFQLVEQLNYEFRDFHAPGAVGSQQSYQVLQVPGGSHTSVDSIEETGSTENGWHWMKYKSGAFQAFGRFQLTVSGASFTGSLYISDPITIMLPFQVTKAFIAGSAASHILLTDTDVSRTNAATIRLLGATTIETGTVINVDLMVSGLYK